MNKGRGRKCSANDFSTTLNPLMFNFSVFQTVEDGSCPPMRPARGSGGIPSPPQAHAPGRPSHGIPVHARSMTERLSPAKPRHGPLCVSMSPGSFSKHRTSRPAGRQTNYLMEGTLQNTKNATPAIRKFCLLFLKTGSKWKPQRDWRWGSSIKIDQITHDYDHGAYSIPRKNQQYVRA